MTLEIYSRSHRRRDDNRREVSYSEVSFRDGQMAALVEQVGYRKYLTTFVKGDLVDTDGNLVREKQSTAEGAQPPSHQTLTLKELSAISQSDEIVLEGTALLEAEENQSAKVRFEKAQQKLPAHPLTNDRQQTLKQLIKQSADNN